MRKINTILFDFDGTIMNTNDVVIESWQHTFRTIEDEERPVETIVKTFGEPLFITMGKSLPQIAADEGVRIYRDFLSKHYEGMIKPFPGMVDLIKRIKNKGYKTGVVTSRARDTTVSGLEQFGLLEYMDSLITYEDTSAHKPNPEPINKALERLFSKPEEAIMVGDTKYDMLCAKNAGVRSVLVGWQMALTEEEILSPEGPDHMIDKPNDLINLLMSVNSLVKED